MASSRPWALLIQGGMPSFLHSTWHNKKVTSHVLPLWPQTWPGIQGQGSCPVASVRRYTAAEWRWACLTSCLWPQGKDTRTNFLVLLGVCAIPLSRFGGMSAAYSVCQWLNLTRDYCWCLLKKRNCTYHTTYHMRHSRCKKTWLWNANCRSKTKRELVVNDILNDSSTKHQIFSWNLICSSMMHSSACTTKKERTGIFLMRLNCHLPAAALLFSHGVY